MSLPTRLHFAQQLAGPDLGSTANVDRVLE
jgi:hypothetical protein